MTPARRLEIENILTWSGTLPSKLAKDAIRELLGEIDRLNAKVLWLERQLKDANDDGILF